MTQTHSLESMLRHKLLLNTNFMQTIPSSFFGGREVEVDRGRWYRSDGKTVVETVTEALEHCRFTPDGI